MQINQCIGQEVTLQVCYQVVTDAIISARTVRPNNSSDKVNINTKITDMMIAQLAKQNKPLGMKSIHNQEIY